MAAAGTISSTGVAVIEIDAKLQQPPAAATAARPSVVLSNSVADNGANTARFLCVCTMLLNLIFTIDTFVMVGLRGRDNTNLANQYSPTLFIFAFIQAFSYMYCIWDCYLTFKGTADKNAALDWDWQHEQFKRICIPLGVNVLLVVPEVFTFVLQSRGDEFFKLLSKSQADGGMDSTTFFRVVMHIVSFGVMMLASIGAFGLTKYTLDNGLFAKDRPKPMSGAASGSGDATATAAEAEAEIVDNVEASLLSRGSSLAALVNKIVAIVTVIAVGWYSASLILGISEELNSGIIIFTILFLIPAVAVFFMSLQLMFKSQLPKNWWLTFRSLTAVLMFLGYLSFWVVLLLYTLLGSDTTDTLTPGVSPRGGFWKTVAEQTPKRAALIYTHLTFFAVYVIASAGRIYWCKLKKEFRQPRVFRLDPHNPPKKKKLAVGDPSRPARTATIVGAAPASNAPATGHAADVPMTATHTDPNVGAVAAAAGGAAAVSIAVGPASTPAPAASGDSVSNIQS